LLQVFGLNSESLRVTRHVLATATAVAARPRPPWLRDRDRRG